MCRLSKMGRKEKGERRYNKLCNTVNLFYHLIKLIAITWARSCLFARDAVGCGFSRNTFVPFYEAGLCEIVTDFEMYENK